MTATPAITADSREGRLLLALRRGPHEPGELAEQFGNLSGLQGQLMRAGLIAYDGDVYTITEAGRAACPFRNPLAAKPAIPEVFIMPKGETHVTRQQVLAVIVAGGAAGITRKALIEKFSRRATEQCIDMHVTALNRQTPPVIFKPKLGVMVGIEHKSAEPAPVVKDSLTTETPAEIAPKPASTAPVLSKAEAAALASPAAHDIHGVSLAVDHHEVADLPPASLAAQMAQIGGRLPAVVEDLTIDDPDTTEFAIYSSGGLDIFTDDCAITLQKPVVAKLRAFLGLFAEAA